MNSADIKKLVNSLTLKLPAKADVAIFDHAGAEVLRNYSLQGFSTSIIFARFEQVIVHPRILLHTILRFLKIIWICCTKAERLRRSDILTAYYWAILDEIGARVVITFIDTVSPFYRLARLDDKATYIAVQNGNRWHLVDSMAKAEIPHFFCFGEFEVDQYKTHCHHVNHFYPVGAIKGDFANRNLDPSFNNLKFDVVLISQWRDPIMVHGTNRDIQQALFTLDDFLLQYVRQTGLKLAIACAGKGKLEIDYFTAKFEKLAEIFPNSPERLSSYRIMQASDVVVTNWSTAGIESLGWSKKTLFCNFSSNPKNGFPTEGPWNLNIKSYEKFQESLSRLVNMSNKEFFDISSDVRRLHMNYPKGNLSAGALLAEAVKKALSSKGPIVSTPLLELS